MVQVSERVASAMNGSMKAEFGSGMASMSEASMDFQPRMEEPSKPRPSEKESSASSEMGMVKCCQVPKVSTNLMSTILAPAFWAVSITFLGVFMLCLSFRIDQPGVPCRERVSNPARPPPRKPAKENEAVSTGNSDRNPPLRAVGEKRRANDLYEHQRDHQIRHAPAGTRHNRPTALELAVRLPLLIATS